MKNYTVTALATDRGSLHLQESFQAFSDDAAKEEALRRVATREMLFNQSFDTVLLELVAAPPSGMGACRHPIPVDFTPERMEAIKEQIRKDAMH